MFPNVYIYSRQRVIQKIQVSIAVHGSSETQSLLLSSTYIDTLRKESQNNPLNTKEDQCTTLSLINISFR